MDSPGGTVQPNGGELPKLAVAEPAEPVLRPDDEKAAPAVSPLPNTAIAEARTEHSLEQQSPPSKRTRSAARPQRTQDPDTIVKAAIDAEAKRAAAAKPELMTGSVSSDNSDAERIIRAALQAEAAKAR
jgi:hypothetical protein